MECSVYCVNLDSRVDRWQMFCESAARSGLNTTCIKRWAAVEDAQFGHLGCLKSHISALSDYLTRQSAPFCLVFEDDFEFLRDFSVLSITIAKCQQSGIIWDALMLQGYYTTAFGRLPAGVAKVFTSCATGGYLIPRRYAPKLLSAFASSVVPLEGIRNHPQRIQIGQPLYADQVWKELQLRDDWYILSPPLGKQAATYSDICGAVPDHIENFRYKG